MAEIKWIRRIPGYHYHDSPEGQDCMKKLVFTNKVGLLFGAFAGTIDVVMMSKPVGFWNIAGRYAFVTGPICAVASSWTAATCISTQLRGKDDPLNYLFGGFVAGSVIGAILRSGTMGTFSAVVIGVVGHGKKELERFGLTYNSDPRTRYPLYFTGIWNRKYYDFSMTEEGTRGWKKSEDEKL